MHFVMHPNGLHYFDPNQKRELTMVQTVKDTSEGYSDIQIRKAKEACKFQAKVGHPSTRDLKNIVKTNMIANCPVTVANIERAEKIFGPSVPILKGKTVRKTPDPVATDYIAVPKSILAANKNITLFGDIFFVNKVPFFTSMSDHLKFMTVSNLKSCKGPDIIQALSKVHGIYTAHGFKPKLVIMDGEFAPHEPEINTLGMRLNTTAANEHIPKIEQQICVIKERAHCIWHTLPFKILPLLMLIKMINHSVLWLNAFPPKGRVSEMISPRMIVIGVPFDYNKHCKWAFGT